MAVSGCLLAMVACERPELSVESLEDGQVKNLYLTGPTNIVCKGEVTDETLSL